jgi:hypothetical protein
MRQQKRSEYERLLRAESLARMLDTRVETLRAAVGDDEAQPNEFTRAIDQAIRLERYIDALKAAWRARIERDETAARAAIIARGETPCDVPWCGCAARFEWVRTAQQLKKMSRKVRGVLISPVPVSLRCSVHVPYFAPELGENYRDMAVSLERAA